MARDNALQGKVVLLVRPRGKPLKKLPESIDVPADAPTSLLYDLLSALAVTSIHRLRITKGSDGTLIPNSGLFVEQTGLRHQSIIYVKDLGIPLAQIRSVVHPHPQSTKPLPLLSLTSPDLGPQIAWRTVFLVEYAGPILIHPLLYLLLPRLSSNPYSHPLPSTLQTVSLALVVAHFLKRELETLFVHRFSSATMPAFNIFRNSAHYWILSGLNMAYWIYHPTSSTAATEGLGDPLITFSGILLFLLGEFGTLSNHLTLRGLRSAGGTERGIPQGLGFNLVTCPNYMFETIAWIGIAIVTWSWSTVLFGVVAAGQMALWAQKKETRYRREFGGRYQKKRYVMIPGIY